MNVRELRTPGREQVFRSQWKYFHNSGYSVDRAACMDVYRMRLWTSTSTGQQRPGEASRPSNRAETAPRSWCRTWEG